MSSLSISYGVSKFVISSVSDRSSRAGPCRLDSCLLCRHSVVRINEAVFGSLALIIAFQTLNGWVNGMGSPPSGKTMVHSFGMRNAAARGVLERRPDRRRRAGASLRPAGGLAVSRLGGKVLFRRTDHVGPRRGDVPVFRDTPQAPDSAGGGLQKNDY